MTLAGINDVTDGTEAEEDAAPAVLDALSKFGATDAGFSEDVLGSAGDAGMGSSEPNGALGEVAPDVGLSEDVPGSAGEAGMGSSEAAHKITSSA